MSSDIKAKIMRQVAPDLALVERALEENLAPNLDLVREIASHLLFSGGKRLRPLLMIHSARICGYETGFEILFSIIFEYLHAATLLHDDVVDEATLRRGKQAAHTKWSAPKVVLTGDFLLARALAIAAKTCEPRVISVIAHITQAMSQGEIDQLEQKGRTDLSEAEYLKIIEQKTAVLIQGACQSGAIISGASEEREKALASYGYHLGMAFQMADDLLDYTATAEELGKNPGADMREGKLTLPLIHSLAKAGDSDRKWMVGVMADPVFDSTVFKNLKEKLTALGGIAYTQSQANDHVTKAKASLGIFEDSDSKALLQMIADYSIERKV
ncbi:MAG: polyprenyl synthetase family protein [Proteobacteria bacterium]|nr:polyprenyl synthetase family protein [Desulfobacula sp.]MBU3953290.1 polyprenyl synthetase family protein [Pseudomonadota bacterium]MBU4133486.1 polyprenyl synthetase family protein [Pseudomonadota bacterium]